MIGVTRWIWFTEIPTSFMMSLMIGDHDIGVERAEQDGEAACGDRDPPVGCRGPRVGAAACCHHTAGLVTVTGLPQSVSVICTLLP